jgi:hypothetical protein
LSDPDQAWKVLAGVSSSIRQADWKAALIMGATGAVSSLLYELYENKACHGLLDDVAVSACGLSAFAAAILATLCLMPRLRSKRGPSSVVYFSHIARRHRSGTEDADYGGLLRSMSADHDRLIGEIANQILANAHVARQKFLMVRLGVMALMTAFAALAMIAATVVRTT